MEDYQIDPIQWYSNRRLHFEPTHFVRAKTLLNKKSQNWIVDTLRGRYTFVPNTSDDSNMFGSPGLQIDVFDYVPSFEDPSEAVFYELTWS